MLPFNLIKSIFHGTQKIVIGPEDIAVEVEVNDGLRFTNGCNLAFWFCCDIFLFGDIGREFYDFIGTTTVVKNGIVGRLCPDIRARFMLTFKLAWLEFTIGKGIPKVAVLPADFSLLVDKNAVMLALNRC